MSIDSLILIASASTNAVLGAFVWRARTQTASARLFLAMVALIIAWAMANYAIDSSTTGTSALFWTRVLYIMAIGYIYLFYLFARTFAREPAPRPGISFTLISLVALGAVLATAGTGSVFSDAVLGPAGLNDLQFGPLYLPINIFALVMAASGITCLVSTARRAGRTVIRDQAVLIIAGWVLFLGLVITFAAILPYFIPAFINGSKIAPLFSVLMVGCTAYAIVRHQFLDITPLIRRGLVYSLLLGTILGFYVLLLFILDYGFHTNSDTLEFLAGVITVVTGIFGAPHIEAYFRRQTDRHFFKDTYEYSAALEELCHVLNTTVRIPQMMTRSLRTLDSILKPERIEFSYHTQGERYLMTGASMPAAGLHLPDENGVRIPVCSDEHQLGEFLLWQKRSGDPYTKEDFSLLRTFASQAVVALEKAELYEELRRYSDQLEEKVRDRTRHLEDLRASQREFIDDASHALQTPLTVLASTMEVVMKGFSQEQGRYVRLATQSIEELSRLIRDLLVLARVEAIPLSEGSTQIDLSEMTDRLCEYVGIVCLSKGIRLSSDVRPGISMTGNRMQIEEAVTNILSNAVRYTEGCPVRSIRVSLTRTTEHAEISVWDTGTGISAERLPHIFKRFYRGQDTQGSGIGLAITKRIVERHSGSICVQSTPGAGTEMIIRFPIQDEAGT